MMNGLYLYCIRNSGGKNIRAHGIDGEPTVFTVSYKKIEAVVSEIDIEKMNSREIAKRAKEDIDWIIEHAARHEKVIKATMESDKSKTKSYKLNTVIPMKFGMIFTHPQNLEDVLRKEYHKFKNLLAHFAEKQEWGVKIYIKELALKEKLKSSEKKVQARIQQTKNLARGADYFGELEVKEVIDNIMQKKTGELSKKFFKFLGTFALESQQNKILDGELAGHKESMVLNGAYLVREDRVSDFIKGAKELQKLNPEFIFEYTGPWPPYNFV
jgi:hypothetical protein